MKRIGVVGCGARSKAYLKGIKDELGSEWKVAALADPNPEARETYRKDYGDSSTRNFDSGPEMFDAMGDELDAVMIGSPNILHLESLLPAIKKNLSILLEKPVAITHDDCETMWKAYCEGGQPPLAVGFVLRYTSFYGKIKELIDSGTIGKVLTIDATELIGPGITQLFTRRWRRHEAVSGPYIVEKCSHDMDILSWLAGTHVEKISSFASRTRFVPDPEAAMNCRQCKLKDSCRYSIFKLDRSRAERWFEEPENITLPIDWDLCVFNSDKDVIDHQVVNIEYENGILASFTTCMDQPKPTRTIRINGTEGQIVGDIAACELRVDLHSKDGSAVCISQKIELAYDNSGHYGGDSTISNQFKSMLREESIPPLAGLREGIEACLVGLAAEKSRHEGRVIMKDEIYGAMFKTNS